MTSSLVTGTPTQAAEAFLDAFARHDVSIRAARQEARGDDAQLIIVSHQARDAALAATVSELESLDAVRAVASVMRVEGEEGSP